MTKTFGQELKRLRVNQMLTQRELADLMGVHYTYISKLEHDDVSPGRELVEALAGLFEVGASYLIELAEKQTKVELIERAEAAEQEVREILAALKSHCKDQFVIITDGAIDWNRTIAEFVSYIEFDAKGLGI
jgi:HTH-type transcriptional regulator, competence development regulator